MVLPKHFLGTTCIKIHIEIHFFHSGGALDATFYTDLQPQSIFCIIGL